MKIIFFAVVSVLLFAAGCMSYDYQGVSTDPVEEAKFIDSMPPEGTYELLGEATVSGNYQKFNLSDMKKRLQKGAEKTGANAILIVSQQVIPTGEAVREPESYISLQSNNADQDYSLNRVNRDFSFGYGNIGRDSNDPGVETYTRTVKAKFIRLDTEKMPPQENAKPAPETDDENRENNSRK